MSHEPRGPIDFFSGFCDHQLGFCARVCVLHGLGLHNVALLFWADELQHRNKLLRIDGIPFGGYSNHGRIHSAQNSSRVHRLACKRQVNSGHVLVDEAELIEGSFILQSYPVWLGYYLDSNSYTYNWTHYRTAIDYSQYSAIGNYQVTMPPQPPSATPVYYGFINASLSVTTIAFVEITQMNIVFNSVSSSSAQFSLICSKFLSEIEVLWLVLLTADLC